jgi:hypothetical protein
MERARAMTYYTHKSATRCRPTVAEVAEAFLEQRRSRYRYLPARRRGGNRAWHVWDGLSWQRDLTQAVYRDALAFARNAGCNVTSTSVERIVHRARLALTE